MATITHDAPLIQLPQGETGPEHVVLRDGKLYAAMASGRILRMQPDGSAAAIYADTGGRVLGFDFDAGGRLIAADAKISPRRLDQRLRLGKDETFGDWRWRERNIFGQAFALIGRKDSEALEEWNGAGLPILLCRSLTFFAGREAVGINDGSAMCSLANIPAERQRLPEGQKTVRAEAILDDS